MFIPEKTWRGQAMAVSGSRPTMRQKIVNKIATLRKSQPCPLYK